LGIFRLPLYPNKLKSFAAFAARYQNLILKAG